MRFLRIARVHYPARIQLSYYIIGRPRRGSTKGPARRSQAAKDRCRGSGALQGGHGRPQVIHHRGHITLRPYSETPSHYQETTGSAAAERYWLQVSQNESTRFHSYRRGKARESKPLRKARGRGAGASAAR